MNDVKLIWEKYVGIKESTESGLFYHGGDWKGETHPFVRRGSFGIGTYFTPDKNAAFERAREYNTKYVVTCKFNNSKFVEIHSPPRFYSQMDVFINMGYPDDEKSISKLDNKINRIHEQHGYMGNEYRKYSEKHNLGYQGIASYTTKKLYEICNWYPYNVKVVNVETV